MTSPIIKTVGLQWLNVVTTSFGLKVQRVDGSYFYWKISETKPSNDNVENRLGGTISPVSIPSGKLWIRGGESIVRVSLDVLTAPDTAGGSGGGSSGFYYTEEITITPTHIAAKRCPLTYPAIGPVTVTPLGGILQQNNVAYYIDNNQFLSWEQLALENLLVVGSTVHLGYMKRVIS